MLGKYGNDPNARTYTSPFLFVLHWRNHARASGAWFTPREAFTLWRGDVDMMRAKAAKGAYQCASAARVLLSSEVSGGNIGVLVGPDGKLLVDAGITASRPRIIDALASLSSEPVTHLINTHWHFDHANGNEWLNEQGAAIVAHANTRKHLMSAQRLDDWHVDFPASPSRAIPTAEIMTDAKDIKLNNTTLRLRYHPSAHTDGDITVDCEANIFHTGDIYWNENLPIHRLLDGWKYR